MGLRLYSEFHSSTDKLFKIEIHDSSFSGTAEAFTVASDGFTLNYSGETDDIVSPIIGSNCTISAYNNSSGFDTFINALKSYQEDRFTVKVYAEADAVEDGLVFGFYDTELPPDGGLALYWTGVIMQDLVTVEDTHKPYIFNITAVDGIGTLANKEYSSTSNVTLEGFIESAVDAIGLDSLYADDDLLYATSVNTWDTQHTYSATTDVTTLTRFSALVYASREEDGTYVYSSYLDVLKELCIAFGARFYQREGVYYFEQYIERTETSRNVSAYYKDGSKAFTSTVSDDVTLDGTTGGGARLAGNSFNFLPALKKVQVSYNQARSNNLLANRLTYTGATGRQDLGFVVDDNNGQIQVTGKLIYQLTHNGNSGTVALEFWRPVWRLELRIEDAANPGTFYYLKRDWNPSGGQLYGATSWSTSASYYHIDAGMGRNDASGAYISSTFSLVTPPLPVDGDAELDVNWYQAYDINNAVQTVPAYFDETNQVKEVTATYFNDTGGISEVTVYSATNTDSTINSNLILDLGELRVSDSTGLQGSFYVYDGSAWVASTQWRRGNSGSYTSLLKLLTNEILALHKKPIERYSGTIVGPYPFGIRYSFDSAYWLPMGGSYNANLDEWTAEWFKVQKDLTNITTDTPVGSGGAADFFGRVSSQQGTDEFINAVDIITTTSEVTGNSTVGGTLGVTGDITASSNITATGDVSATDITASGEVGAGSADITGTLNAGNTTVVDLQARNTTTTGTAAIAGDATLESNLEVQGDATTQGVTTQNGALVNSVTDLSHSDGSSYSVVASDYMLFNSWTGGGDNAEAVVNLPSAASNEGRLLRFKSDDTITANKRVILVPSGSETIDGVTSYTMNRSYDGIMLLAHNDRWYIIQRKEK